MFKISVIETLGPKLTPMTWRCSDQHPSSHNKDQECTIYRYMFSSYNVNQLSSSKFLNYIDISTLGHVFPWPNWQEHLFIQLHIYIHSRILDSNQISKTLQERDSTQLKSYLGSNLDCKNPDLEFTLGRPDWHGKEHD